MALFLSTLGDVGSARKALPDIEIKPTVVDEFRVLKFPSSLGDLPRDRDPDAPHSMHRAWQRAPP
jgi:hypothetical protein